MLLKITRRGTKPYACENQQFGEVLSVIFMSLLLWQGTNAGRTAIALLFSPAAKFKQGGFLKESLCRRLDRGKGQTYEAADDVALVNEEYNLAVHCRKIDSKKTFVTIIVAHNASFAEAKGLALNIRRGMETGIFE